MQNWQPNHAEQNQQVDIKKEAALAPVTRNLGITGWKKKASKKARRRMEKFQPSKYWLYENSVQEAADDAEILEDLYKRLQGKKPTRLREDFCGTHKVACEWVRRSSKHTAMGLDIDPEPLSYGELTHASKLTADQRKRLRILQKDVNSSTKPLVDVVAACNFSYWIFKTRKELVRYFKHVYRSLDKNGVFFLDHVGGYEMVQETTDKETYGKGKKKFTYIWKQEGFNPINNEGIFSISYRLANGLKYDRVFEYDWRVWSIREIRECLEEAGFKKTNVFWELDDEKGDGGSGDFAMTEKEENCPVHISYIAARKKA